MHYEKRKYRKNHTHQGREPAQNTLQESDRAQEFMWINTSYPTSLQTLTKYSFQLSLQVQYNIRKSLHDVYRLKNLCTPLKNYKK